MTVIHKTSDDCRVTPNFREYERTRAEFAWSDVPDLCEGLGAGACNIAYAAVDRHADGPAAPKTALRRRRSGGAEDSSAVRHRRRHNRRSRHS